MAHSPRCLRYVCISKYMGEILAVPISPLEVGLGIGHILLNIIYGIYITYT